MVWASDCGVGHPVSVTVGNSEYSSCVSDCGPSCVSDCGIRRIILEYSGVFQSSLGYSRVIQSIREYFGVF